MTISPNALITSDGSVATGSVQIAMTYWHPKKSLASVVGSLLSASSGNTTVPLETFGMADIEITQNSNALQVNPGHTLGLQFNVPQAQWLDLNARIQTVNVQSNLYSLDMNTGLWNQEATPADATSLRSTPTTVCSWPRFLT